jgi:hypothetical protein
MRFYEVSETIRPGFPITQEEGHKPYISMVAHDDEYGTPACLALGRSVYRELQHPDDHPKPFKLYWGKYENTTAGYMLVSQTKEESNADGHALVLITRCYLPDIGITKVESADAYLRPERLTYARGDGIQRDLFLMQPGSGLFIKWDKRLLGTDRSLTFIIAWDAETQELRMEAPKPKAPYRRWQQRSARPAAAELHP